MEIKCSSGVYPSQGKAVFVHVLALPCAPSKQLHRQGFLICMNCLSVYLMHNAKMPGFLRFLCGASMTSVTDVQYGYNTALQPAVSIFLYSVLLTHV